MKHKIGETKASLFPSLKCFKVLTRITFALHTMDTMFFQIREKIPIKSTLIFPFNKMKCCNVPGVLIYFTQTVCRYI